MEIKQGDVLTLKDLAVFFDKSYGTIRNNKNKWLQLFNSFCNYHIDKRKRIVIDEVIFSTYEKYQIDAYISQFKRTNQCGQSRIFI